MHFLLFISHILLCAAFRCVSIRAMLHPLTLLFFGFFTFSSLCFFSSSFIRVCVCITFTQFITFALTLSILIRFRYCFSLVSCCRYFVVSDAMRVHLYRLRTTVKWKRSEFSHGLYMRIIIIIEIEEKKKKLCK